MSTQKKHIGVYLEPALEKALIDFCASKGLKSKKGTKFSAGVNAVLAEFFGIHAEVKSGNVSQQISNHIKESQADIRKLRQSFDKVEADIRKLHQGFDEVEAKIASLVDATNF